MTPSVFASAFIISSSMLRLTSHRARTAEWEAMMGAFDSSHHRALRRVRDVHHHPEAVHFGDDALAHGGDAVLPQVAVALTSVRIRQLVVAVVGERHVAAAAVVELLDAAEVLADGVRVLH